MEAIKISNHALNLIPQDKIIVFSSSWEDNNIWSNEKAKIDCQKIGSGVMFLTGDYVIPPCAAHNLYPDNHFGCEVYDATYTIAWVSDDTWGELGDSLMKADREWREWAGKCKGEAPLGWGGEQ